MEKYPLYINGIENGSIKVYKDGLMICFEAECEDKGELVRLYIFGNGTSACLGTMQPVGNTLHLLKKLSRSEFNKLPQPIEYAADAQLKNEEVCIEEAEYGEESGDDGLLWFSTPNGYLTCFDGRQSLVALPAESIRLAHDSGILREINGKKYVIFPGKRNVSLSGNLP